MEELSKTVFVSVLSAGCVVLTDAADTWNKKVSGQTNISYLDLARKVFPDAAFDTKDPERLTASDKIALENPLKIVFDGKFFGRCKGRCRSLWTNN
jgi:hypothetical protein